jgi:integrase
MARKKRSRDGLQQDGRRSDKHTHIGDVTIYQRGLSWYLYYREGGVPRRVPVGRDRDVAVKRAAEVNAQLAYGVRSTFQFERIKVEELVPRWLDHHELVLRSKMSTVSRYRNAIEHLVRFIKIKRPNIAVDALTTPVAEEFVKHLRTVPISPNGHARTRKRVMRDRGILGVLRTCRAFWNYAAKHRHVPPYSTNPFTEIRIECMRIDNMKPKVILTQEQEETFLRACDPWEFRLFFSLAFTGMRPGELRHMLVEDVDFGIRTAFIRNHPELGWHTKTRGERRVYLFDELLAVFREAIGFRKTGPAFLARRYSRGHERPPLADLDRPALALEMRRRIEGAIASAKCESARTAEARAVKVFWKDMGAIRQSVVRSRFIRIARKMGRPDLTQPYSFRHGMATAMQAADVDPFARKQIIGHTSLAMTEIYTHTADLAIARGMTQAANTRPKSLDVARERLNHAPREDGGEAQKHA